MGQDAPRAALSSLVRRSSLPEVSWTKEGSYQFANEWWTKQLAELNQPTKLAQAIQAIYPPVDEMKRVIEMATIYRRMLTAGPPELIDEFEADEIIGTNLVPLDEPRRLEHLAEIGNKVGAVVVSDNRLDAHTARFLEIERAKCRKPRTFGELSETIAIISDTTYKGKIVLSPTMDVRKIDKTTVEDFYLYLRNESGREPSQQKKFFGFFKRLIRHLFAAEMIQLPRNLDFSWDFGVTAKKVKAYDRNEVVTLLKRLPPRLKLYALLGLNCGMLAVDISSLRKDEIDWTRGRIIRKRTKTEDRKDVPVVDYPLWPITLKLLKQCLSADPDLALTTSTGTPLVACRVEANGHEKRKNMVRDQWKRAKTKIPHKAFRSIGATALYNEKEYRGWTGYYLGHSAKTEIEMHYAADTDEGRKVFDKIITWLGKQFDMV